MLKIRSNRWAVCLVAALALIACSPAPESVSSLELPKQFFAEHTIGSSPDYGIIKSNNPRDHVISVHGFRDDAATCQEVADALNANACKELGGEQCLDPYSCIALNTERTAAP